MCSPSQLSSAGSLKNCSGSPSRAATLWCCHVHGSMKDFISESRGGHLPSVLFLVKHLIWSVKVVVIRSCEQEWKQKKSGCWGWGGKFFLFDANTSRNAPLMPLLQMGKNWLSEERCHTPALQEAGKRLSGVFWAGSSEASEHKQISHE